MDWRSYPSNRRNRSEEVEHGLDYPYEFSLCEIKPAEFNDGWKYRLFVYLDSRQPIYGGYWRLIGRSNDLGELRKIARSFHGIDSLAGAFI